MSDLNRSLSSTSLENALDLFSKARGFPRTDSEDQFRKFLERIPSTTNLAGYSGSMQNLPQAQQEQLQQQMAQFQSQNLLSSSSNGMTAQLPDHGSLNVGGIPRVPSLDLLRQMFAQPQYQGTPKSSDPGPVKDDGGEPASAGPGSDGMQGSLQSLPAMPLAGLASMPMTLPISQGINGISLPMPLTASMPMTSLPDAEPVPTKSKRSDPKAEIRRARRMLSNRESARRSRKRKQEHLGNLEEQISTLEEERDQWQEKAEKLEKQLAHEKDVSQKLRLEVEDLRQQLGLEIKEEKKRKLH